MSTRNAAGSGTIRKKTVQRNGKAYTYWEARYTSGFNPGTGKQIQKSITGKTQKEVARKLKEATSSIDRGTYTDPSKTTVGEWLDFWLENYAIHRKYNTYNKYKRDIKNHIKPGLGAVVLQSLTTDQIQHFYNSLELAPKTVKNIHGTLHKALDQAVKNGRVAKNAAENCELSKATKPKINPLTPSQLVSYVHASEDDPLHNMFLLAAFAGLRRGELLGLTWDCVDFARGSVTVKQQLQRIDGRDQIVATKSDNVRIVYPAPFVMDGLRQEHSAQLCRKTKNADYYFNPWGLCFTGETGGHISAHMLRDHHKKVLKAAGLPDIRLHDLRHSFAVASLMAGDDIKTLQSNLGHATSSFTLDVYAHVVDDMRHASADRMQALFDTEEKACKGKSKGKQQI